MSEINMNQELEKKEKEIMQVLGVNQEEFDSLFADNSKEIADFFREEHFTKEQKAELKKMFNIG